MFFFCCCCCCCCCCGGGGGGGPVPGKYGLNGEKGDGLAILKAGACSPEIQGFQSGFRFIIFTAFDEKS